MKDKFSLADVDMALELLRNIKASYIRLYNDTKNDKYQEKLDAVKKVEKEIYNGSSDAINIAYYLYNEYKELEGGLSE